MRFWHSSHLRAGLTTTLAIFAGGICSCAPEKCTTYSDRFEELNEQSILNSKMRYITNCGSYLDFDQQEIVECLNSNAKNCSTASGSIVENSGDMRTLYGIVVFENCQIIVISMTAPGESDNVEFLERTCDGFSPSMSDPGFIFEACDEGAQHSACD
jgi:hypothetical protein